MKTSEEVKQVIVVRKDLNMRKGKIAAQVAHAAMAFLTSPIRMVQDEKYFQSATERNFFGHDPKWNRKIVLDDESVQWIDGAFTKVVVSVNSEAELLAVYQDAKMYGCKAQLITDAGRTEFHGVPTNTCVAVGPNFVSKVDAVTKALPLL